MQTAHGCDLRKGRHSAAGNVYLLTSVTYERRPVFLDFAAARICIQTMRYQHASNRVESHAYVLMPDHFHWLFTLLEQSSLSAVMQSVKGFSSRKITECTGYRGTVWQRGYHDRALRSDEDLRQLARYVVANPLRAGLVRRIMDYPHWDAVWYEPELLEV